MKVEFPLDDIEPGLTYDETVVGNLYHMKGSLSSRYLRTSEGMVRFDRLLVRKETAVVVIPANGFSRSKGKVWILLPKGTSITLTQD